MSDFFQRYFSHKDFLEWHIFLKSFGWDLKTSDGTVQYKTALPSRAQCWEGVCTYLVQLQLPTLLCLGLFRAHLLVITGESSEMCHFINLIVSLPQQKHSIQLSIQDLCSRFSAVIVNSVVIKYFRPRLESVSKHFFSFYEGSVHFAHTNITTWCGNFLSCNYIYCSLHIFTLYSGTFQSKIVH